MVAEEGSSPCTSQCLEPIALIKPGRKVRAFIELPFQKNPWLVTSFPTITHQSQPFRGTGSKESLCLLLTAGDSSVGDEPP